MNAGPGVRRANAARPRARRSTAVSLVLAAALVAGTPGAAAGLPRTCEEPDPPDAARVALALRVAAAVQRELARLQAPVAIVARAGLDLSLLGQRYSHAGVSLRDHPQGAWTVRQLYFACEEGRPRIFDQGLAAFVLGNDRQLKLFGLGMAVAVLVDATVVRMILVPATMELLGGRNWWMPRWLDRVLPRIEVEGGSHAAATSRPDGDSPLDDREPELV